MPSDEKLESDPKKASKWALVELSSLPLGGFIALNANIQDGDQKS